MAVKRHGCGSCPSYSRTHGRCLQGKVNPPTVKGCLDAARFFGLGYICNRDGMASKIAGILIPDITIDKILN